MQWKVCPPEFTGIEVEWDLNSLVGLHVRGAYSCHPDLHLLAPCNLLLQNYFHSIWIRIEELSFKWWTGYIWEFESGIILLCLPPSPPLQSLAICLKQDLNPDNVEYLALHCQSFIFSHLNKQSSTFLSCFKHIPLTAWSQKKTCKINKG